MMVTSMTTLDCVTYSVTGQLWHPASHVTRHQCASVMRDVTPVLHDTSVTWQECYVTLVLRDTCVRCHVVPAAPGQAGGQHDLDCQSSSCRGLGGDEATALLNCTELYYTALHCTALYCTALHYTVLHCTELYYSKRQQETKVMVRVSFADTKAL